MQAGAQTKSTDSLRHIIDTIANEKEKLASIIMLVDYSLNPDTLLPYIAAAETIAHRANDKFDIDRVAAARASYYIRKNHVDSALDIINTLIKKYKTDNSHQPYYLSLLFSKSKILDRANRYTEALTQLLSLIHI